MFCPCVSSAVSGIRTLKTSFSPCGRRGRGDEGQKARECRKPHHHAGPGVASIASSWLSSPPVAPDAGWKPAHPAEGLRSLAMSSRSPVAPRAGRRPAHPGNSGRMLQDSDAKSIQIGHGNALRAFTPQQNNDWQFGRSFLSSQNLQLAAQAGDTHIRQRTTYCYHND